MKFLLICNFKPFILNCLIPNFFKNSISNESYTLLDTIHPRESSKSSNRSFQDIALQN